MNEHFLNKTRDQCNRPDPPQEQTSSPGCQTSDPEQPARPTWISSSDNHTRCRLPHHPCYQPSVKLQTPQTLVKPRDDPLLSVSLSQHWQDLPLDHESVKMIGERLDDTSCRCSKDRKKEKKKQVNGECKLRHHKACMHQQQATVIRPETLC